MLPIEVERAFRRGSQILLGEAGEVDLAIGRKAATGPVLREQCADRRRVELLELNFEGISGLVAIAAQGVQRAGTMDVPAEQVGF